MRKMFFQEFDFALSLEVWKILFDFSSCGASFISYKKTYGQMIIYGSIDSILLMFCSTLELVKVAREVLINFSFVI
jgi:hypothetical protein